MVHICWSSVCNFKLTSNSHKNLSKWWMWNASSCVTATENCHFKEKTEISSCGSSKESRSRWICCYASAGLFYFGWNRLKAVYQKWGMRTQTSCWQEDCDSTCWDAAQEEKRNKAKGLTIYMRHSMSKQTSQQGCTSRHFKPNVPSHAHWISSQYEA